MYKYEYKYNSDNKNKKYNVIIVEKQKECDNKVTYVVKLNNDKFILNIYTKNQYDISKNFSDEKINEVISFKYGDLLEINGKIIVPELLGNIGEFNYKKYLNSKGIVGSINAYDVNYVDNVGNKYVKLIYKLKNYISAKIDNNLDEKPAELLKGMLYGDTKNLDQEIKEMFQNIGISHITAVSGSNLSVFLVIFTIVLNKLNLNKNLYTIIQICLITIFCLISNVELSVLRAGIMMVISIVYKLKNIKISIEKALILTLFVLLCFNPYRIFNIGMILSFLATISIAVFYLKLYNFFESKIYWKVKNKIMRKFLLNIFGIISITLASNILILPISINTFNTFSIMFVISNLFVSTLSTCINILGVISVIIPKIPIIFNLLWYGLNICLTLLINISESLNNIAINIKIRDIPLVIIFIYYLYIFLIYIGYKINGNKKLLRNKIKRIKQNLIFLFILSICIWNVCINFFNNYIYYFNVGQGEMTVIKNKDTVIMIDSGSITNDTSYIFKSYMAKEGIDEIDALIISHFHSDHINGIVEIAKDCKIEYLIYAYPYDIKNEGYVTLLQNLDKENIKHILVNAGDNIKIDDIKINILFPNVKYITVGNEIDENENANSLVLNISINNKNYLFMGDCLKESETYILNEIKKQNISSIEILKVGHHGSKTSTSEKFIQYTLPKYAVISCKNKVYNHPSKETINILNKYSVKTYITEKIGGIKYII